MPRKKRKPLPHAFTKGNPGGKPAPERYLPSDEATQKRIRKMRARIRRTGKGWHAAHAAAVHFVEMEATLLLPMCSTATRDGRSHNKARQRATRYIADTWQRIDRARALLAETRVEDARPSTDPLAEELERRQRAAEADERSAG